MKPNRKSDKLYLRDMAAAIRKIETYLKDASFETFSQEPMRQDAVIRQLELIGEAAGKLSKHFRNEYPEFPARYARMLRNFLIHDYDQIDVETIWYTTQESVPRMKKQLDSILETYT